MSDSMTRHPDSEEADGVRQEGPMPPSASDVSQRGVVRSVFLIVTCTLALIVNSANQTSTSIALPTIGRDLNTDASQLQWLVSAYTLSSGCLLILFGRLADLYGRRKIFVGGATWTLAFSLGCAFAPSDIALDVLRGFQGIGSAAMIPAALGILAHSFPPSKARSIAFSTFSAGAPVGAAFGYALGGLVTQLTSQTWRSTFYISAGLSALATLGGIFTVDPDLPSQEPDKRVDWLGAALVTAGLVLIVFVLSGGEIAPNGWRTAYIIACLVLGVVLLAAFIAWQHFLEKAEAEERPRIWWSPPPLMRLSIWARAHGRFGVVNCIGFLIFACFISWTFWMSLYYQDYVKLTPILTVVRMLPMVVTGCICNLVVILVISRVPVVFIILFGALATSTAALLFALINPAAPYWSFGFPSMILSVCGADFVVASGSIFVASVALPHEQSLAGALFQTMTQIGTSFGLTITTIVYDSVSRRSLGDTLPAYKAAQWTAFGFAALAAVLAASFLPHAGIVGHRKPKSNPEPEADDAVEKDHATHEDA